MAYNTSSNILTDYLRPPLRRLPPVQMLLYTTFTQTKLTLWYVSFSFSWACVLMSSRFLVLITDETPLVRPTGVNHSLSTHGRIIAAFALSSGTIGAAMSSSLSKMRSIALSYGTMIPPTPEAYFDPAHNQGCRIINYLWNNWGEDEYGLRDGEVDLYTVNIPLIEQILGVDGLKVCWTRLWRNSYGQLFKNVSGSIGHPTVAVGPGPLTGQTQTLGPEEAAIGSLLFKWSPNVKELASPPLDSLPIGSDTWALHQGLICVTPLRASFGEPHSNEVINKEDILWKVRL